MSCASCGADVPYVAQITPSGIREACPQCGFAPPKETEQPKAEPEKAKPVAPSAPPPKPVDVKCDDRSLVEQVRSRIAELDVEIERLEAARRERKTLAAMLKAAERVKR